MSETYVLIHGTWHGGWAWQGVIRQLEARGHRAYAPTLIGHGPADERAGITHGDCVDSVVSYIMRHDLRDVILVGHSFGGSVISRAVEYLPDRIKRLVFLDAFVLEDGQSIYDNLPGFLIELLDQLTQTSTTVTLKRWDGSTGSSPLCGLLSKIEPEKPSHNEYSWLNGTVVLEAVRKASWRQIALMSYFALTSLFRSQ